VARPALVCVALRSAQDVDGDLIGLDRSADFDLSPVGEELFAARTAMDGGPTQKVGAVGEAIDNGPDRISQVSP
jgi:hypothetical protein